MQKNTIYSPVSLLLMRLGLLIIFFSISILAFSQNDVQYFEPLDVEKVENDVDSIRMEMDSTFYYISETCKILLEEVELLGLKKTIQINVDIFKQYIFFIVLYIIWLIRRH